MRQIQTFDIDGVIFMGEYPGIKPHLDDIIITGRSFEESEETYQMLREKQIFNRVYFNPLPFSEKTRETSGQFKADKINELLKFGYRICIHYEDDPIQSRIISHMTPVNVVLLVHNLVEKENVRHDKW